MPGLDSDLYAAWEMARERHRDLIKAAAISRVLAEARTRRAGGWQRFWMWVADVLIAFGMKLKARYQASNGQTYAPIPR